MRGDWFLATATKPPLYERLLDIPDTLDELADDLGIDISRQHQPPGPGPAHRPDAHRLPQLGRVGVTTG